MPYPINPHYGDGVFRRRIALFNRANHVLVQLEDCNHAFQLELFHNGTQVLDVRGQALRYPLSTCPGAERKLLEFIGQPLLAQRSQLRAIHDSRQHCTHLYDMVALGMAQALRASAQRIYDVTIPDFRNGQTTAQLHCDGHLIHDWTITNQDITQPEHLKNRPLLKKFSEWAVQVFSGDDLETAFVLQMGCFVAQGRAYDVEAMAGQAVQPTRIPLGACHSYQPETISQGTRNARSTRDFTDTPEQLLKFI